VESTKVSLFVCLAVATGLGTWYLGVWVPDNQWRLADLAGQRSMEREHYGEAERQFAVAVEAARPAGDHDPRLGLALFHLAQALVAQSKNSEALPLLERCLALNEKALGLNHPDVSHVLEYQAGLLRRLDRPAEAEAAEQRAAMIRSRLEQTNKKAR